MDEGTLRKLYRSLLLAAATVLVVAAALMPSTGLAASVGAADSAAPAAVSAKVIGLTPGGLSRSI